ncbi:MULTISPECIES: acetaldehyde dehydrogenase (acetylating) [unclassified Brevibacterium]|uniref:acetaldehyde dehydrogenase (acetylating) n=1 Tax=unclassified Brevibacterium TaxID=2614124 RepID=UPI0010921A38|nr:acetaldehyde dehydrogenase (acetylating) [Brevibacterium sp. S22]TGD32563.1 acetaldehyde dehydrogenase (acetylating) [Brevibacterium sp. S22]
MSSKVAIIGSGNIGTDLMFKVLRLSKTLEFAIMVGIDPTSDGLTRAKKLGFETTAEGVDGLIASPLFDEIDIVFDATSAGAHQHNAAKLAPYNKQLIDLTPAAIGPYVVPSVNLEEHLDATNVNMVTCGGQATIPIVAAVGSVVPVHYAEIVASIASASAGPGTRANIDEFTETTSTALEVVGGAANGKAIIVLNPAEPPVIMRDTVQVIIDRADNATREAISQAVKDRVAGVAEYVPGYRLKQQVQFLDDGTELDQLIPDERRSGAYTRVAVFLEVEGAAMYLPAYAGNLDIMTSAALRTAESLAAKRAKEQPA